MDWPGLMQLGLRHLRLSPRMFWALTPAELLLLSGQGVTGDQGGMGRARLEALSRAYPDLTTEQGNDRGSGCGQ